MKILVIADCYLPSTKSGAKLIHDLAIEFLNQKHVPIVAVPDAELKDASKVSVEEGITVLRIRTDRIKGAGKFVRAINEIRLSSIMWKSGRSFFEANPCELIVFYSPSIFFGSLVKRLKKLWNCKAYLVLRDIFPQWVVDTGILRKGLVFRFFRMMEDRQYSVADVIGVQSLANLQYFTARGIGNKYQLEVLYNWTTLTEKCVPYRDHRKKFNLQNKIVFFYGGNLGIAQDTDCIIRLAERLHDKPYAYFLLVGEGSETARIRKTICERKLTNISVHSAVSQHEYLGMLAEFDVGIIALDGNLNTHNFPGKMLGYMYFSKPILASVNVGNDLKHILDNANAGMTCIAGEDDQLYENAVKLLEDFTLRKKIGQNGRSLLEKTFSAENAASQIITSCV
jgi:glycosyltransferase involved in cell wall biosynthesis